MNSFANILNYRWRMLIWVIICFIAGSVLFSVTLPALVIIFQGLKWALQGHPWVLVSLILLLHYLQFGVLDAYKVSTFVCLICLLVLCLLISCLLIFYAWVTDWYEFLLCIGCSLPFLIIELYDGSISGGNTVRRAIEFGRTYVVRPKGKHQATVVWLHGLGDNGSR